MIPSMENGINMTNETLTRAKKNETVCCDEDACLPEDARICTPAEITEQEDEMAVLVNGKRGWSIALNIENQTKLSAISDTAPTIVEWFDSSANPTSINPLANAEATEDAHSNTNYLEINGHASALAPIPLIDSATKLDIDYKSGKPVENVAGTKTIQFAGGGQLYSMTLSKERTKSFTSTACWKGCNVDSVSVG